MFLQGGGQCFSSLSQEPSMKGLRRSWLPGLGVGGGLGTTVAQVETHWHGPRKACTDQILLPLWPGRIICPYTSEQHLCQRSNLPPLCSGNTSLM